MTYSGTGETTFNIKAFYKRLGAIGLDKTFVKASLLPDWWCDEFEEDNSAVVEAAAHIARRTNLDFQALLDPAKDLTFSVSNNPCYKLRKGTEESSLAVFRAIAERLSEVVAFGTSKPLSNLVSLSALAVRSQIMQSHEFVTLEGLLDFCWGVGIPVIHAGKVPKGKDGKKFDGMVGIYGDRPVILIGKNHPSPAWLAFIVAHELGHILCRHVQAGSSIVDVKVNPDEKEDAQEIEADEFAVELIYGDKTACYYCLSNLYPSDLVKYACSNSVKDKVNPASVALNYGWYKEKMVITKKEKNKVWGLVGAALKELEDQIKTGAEVINSYLLEQLDWNSLGDDSQEFVERMAGIG